MSPSNPSSASFELLGMILDHSRARIPFLKWLEEQQQQQQEALGAELAIKQTELESQRRRDALSISNAKKDEEERVRKEEECAKNSEMITIEDKRKNGCCLNNADWKKSNAAFVRKKESATFREEKSAFTLPKKKMNGR